MIDSVKKFTQTLDQYTLIALQNTEGPSILKCGGSQLLSQGSAILLCIVSLFLSHCLDTVLTSSPDPENDNSMDP